MSPGPAPVLSVLSGRDQVAAIPSENPIPVISASDARLRCDCGNCMVNSTQYSRQIHGQGHLKLAQGCHLYIAATRASRIMDVGLNRYAVPCTSCIRSIERTAWSGSLVDGGLSMAQLHFYQFNLRISEPSCFQHNPLMQQSVVRIQYPLTQDLCHSSGGWVKTAEPLIRGLRAGRFSPIHF